MVDQILSLIHIYLQIGVVSNCSDRCYGKTLVNDEHSHYLHADLGSCDGPGGSPGLAQIESSDVVSPSAPVGGNRHSETWVGIIEKGRFKFGPKLFGAKGGSRTPTVLPARS